MFLLKVLLYLYVLILEMLSHRAILHDPEVYTEPMSFKPERFLLDDGTLNDDEIHPAFGFGRRYAVYSIPLGALTDVIRSVMDRLCPGMHLSNQTLWIMVASVLALFDISKAKDAQGVEVPVYAKFTTGLVR